MFRPACRESSLAGSSTEWRRQLPSNLTHSTSNDSKFLSSWWFFQKKVSTFRLKKDISIDICSCKPDKRIMRTLSLETPWLPKTDFKDLKKEGPQQCRVACYRGQRSVLWQLIGMWQYIGHDCLTGTFTYILLSVSSCTDQYLATIVDSSVSSYK